MNTQLAQYGPLTARIFIGLLFIISGISKVMAFEGTVGYIASVGLPAAFLLAILAIITELVAGAMLVVGWRPRLAALWLIVFLLITIAFFHSEFSDQNQLTQALKNLAIAGGLLMIATYGHGKYGIGCACGARMCPDCAHPEAMHSHTGRSASSV